MTVADSESKPWLGLLGGAVAVLIWAGWISATRWSMVERIDPLVLAAMRNGLPALILAPVWLRRGHHSARCQSGRGLDDDAGLGHAVHADGGDGVADGSGLACSGLWCRGLRRCWWRGWAGPIFSRVPGRGAALGLGLMAVALACVLGQWIAAGRWQEMGGAPFLFAASLGISIFTVMLPRSGLNPVEGTAYICLYSLPFLGLGLLLRPGAFVGLDAGDLAFQAVTQGLLTGLIAVLAYGVAIRHLGPLRGSTANALVPVTAAVFAILLLSESLTPLDWVAVACSSLGVAAVNGVFDRWLGRGAAVR